MKKERVWIGLGSNLSNPKKQIDNAVQTLSGFSEINFIACSRYYRSKPLGNKLQPDFLNAVMVVDTNLTPEALLNYMQYIEKKQGRIHSLLRWKSRTLDLDILLFGKYIISTSKLIIPHYDLCNREFVVYPLMELDSNLIFPNGLFITDVIKTVPKNNLQLWKG